MIQIKQTSGLVKSLYCLNFANFPHVLSFWLQLVADTLLLLVLVSPNISRHSVCIQMRPEIIASKNNTLLICYTIFTLHNWTDRQKNSVDSNLSEQDLHCLLFCYNILTIVPVEPGYALSLQTV